MDNQDELQELDLEAIMREFHDPSKDMPSEEPETATDPDQDAAAADAPGEAAPGDVPGIAETPEEEMPLPASMEKLDITQVFPEEDGAQDAAADSSATIRIDTLSDVRSEASPDVPAGQEPDAESDSADAGTEEAQPAKEPIPFSPRARLRELKTKLIAGPEKRYYELEEIGVGKLQVAILPSLPCVLWGRFSMPRARFPGTGCGFWLSPRCWPCCSPPSLAPMLCWMVWVTSSTESLP